MTSVGGLVASGAIALAAVSWLDDRRQLAPVLRLAVQCVVVGVMLWKLPVDFQVVAGLPHWLERLGIMLFDG